MLGLQCLAVSLWKRVACVTALRAPSVIGRSTSYLQAQIPSFGGVGPLLLGVDAKTLAARQTHVRDNDKVNRESLITSGCLHPTASADGGVSMRETR